VLTPPGQHKRSVSQIKQFRRCPESFRLERIERLGGKPSAAAIQGSAFHEAYRLWESSGRTVRPDLIFTKLYDEMIEEERQVTPLDSWQVWGKGVKVLPDIAKRRESGIEQIQKYCNRVANGTDSVIELPDGSLAIEVPFEVAVGPGIVRGQIDVLYRSGTGINVVRDLKTGVRESSAFQLGVYALAAEKQYEIPCKWGDYYYAKDDTTTPPIDLSHFTEEYISSQVRVIESAIANNLFMAQPSSGCFSCPVSGHCREFG
jgi:putative RecB family exonuclease